MTSLLEREMEALAQSWPAVGYDPHDPNAADIVAAAHRVGLIAVPDPNLQPRSLRGRPLPDAEPDLEAIGDTFDRALADIAAAVEAALNVVAQAARAALKSISDRD